MEIDVDYIPGYRNILAEQYKHQEKCKVNKVKVFRITTIARHITEVLVVNQDHIRILFLFWLTKKALRISYSSTNRASVTR